MKKIILLCAAGMSTSLLVTNMKKASQEQGLDYEIAAYPVAEAEKVAADAAAVLLGPQVRFAVKDVQKKLPNVPVDSIDMRDYGTMNGKKVLAKAQTMIVD